MPSSVSSLLVQASLTLSGQVRWGKRIPDDSPGVYLVAISSKPDRLENPFGERAPIDHQKIGAWIDRVPGLTLDAGRPSIFELQNRLSEYWLPDETILYIGKTSSSLKGRMNDFYRTQLGNRSPHAGGHWLKTLSVLDKMHVYWATNDEPESSEEALLKHFVGNVSDLTRQKLRDPARPFPFANLEISKRRHDRKMHGIERSVLRYSKTTSTSSAIQ